MKTVPTVHVAELADTASFPQLPEEVTLALTDIAGAAREGLLAMSVAAGMAVMQAMWRPRSRNWPAPRASTTRTGPRTGTVPRQGR